MHDHKGFTLLELLIALLIVAIGVLGHAKMQVRSMDTAQRGSFAQTANTALLDLAQRMRANSAIASQFVINHTNTDNAITGTTDCFANTCTDAQFAQAELAEWFNNLQGRLPFPRFSVAQNGDLYTLTLIWDAAKQGVGSNSCNTANVNSYQCGSMDIWIP